MTKEDNGTQVTEITDKLWDELATVARDVAQNAYAPYSKFRVGAALLGEDGVVYPGCNVENASFGATICAERSAICSAVSNGTRKFVAIAIYNSSDHPAAPCGICRQVLSEFNGRLPCLLFGDSEERLIKGLDEILPMQFSKEDFFEECPTCAS